MNPLWRPAVRGWSRLPDSRPESLDLNRRGEANVLCSSWTGRAAAALHNVRLCRLSPRPRRATVGAIVGPPTTSGLRGIKRIPIPCRLDQDFRHEGLQQTDFRLSRIAPSEMRRASNVRRSRTIRPVLETLESIDLLSTIHGHATTIHRDARVHDVVKTAGIQTILPINYGVTGVRQDVGGNVVITGGTGPPSLTDGTPAFIYDGPLNQIPSNTSAASLHLFDPTFAGETVTSSQFYGPNTPLFDPSIGAGNITAVGAYRYTGSNYQNGMIYTGPLDGSGTYTQTRRSRRWNRCCRRHHSPQHHGQSRRRQF